MDDSQRCTCVLGRGRESCGASRGSIRHTIAKSSIVATTLDAYSLRSHVVDQTVSIRYKRQEASISKVDGASYRPKEWYGTQQEEDTEAECYADSVKQDSDSLKTSSDC